MTPAPSQEQRKYDDVTPDVIGHYVTVQLSNHESVSGKLQSYTYENRTIGEGDPTPHLDLTLEIAQEAVTVRPLPSDKFLLLVSALVKVH